MNFDPRNFVNANADDNNVYHTHNLMLGERQPFVHGLADDILNRIRRLRVPGHHFGQILFTVYFEGDELFMSTPFERLDNIGDALQNLINRAGESRGIEIQFGAAVTVDVDLKVVPVDGNAPNNVQLQMLGRGRRERGENIAQWNYVPRFGDVVPGERDLMAEGEAERAAGQINIQLALQQARAAGARANAERAAARINAEVIESRLQRNRRAKRAADQRVASINRSFQIADQEDAFAEFHRQQQEDTFAEFHRQFEANKRRRRYRGLADSPSQHSSALMTTLKKTRAIEYLFNTDDLCVPRAILYLMMRHVHGYHRIISIMQRDPDKTPENCGVTLACSSPEMAEHFMSILDRIYGIAQYQSRFNMVSKEFRVSTSSTKFKTLSKALCTFCEVDHVGGVGDEGLTKFETALNTRIRVYRVLGGYSKVYDGNVEIVDSFFYLLAEGSHVHPIRNVKFLKNCSYMCEECDEFYTSRWKHMRCPYRCKHCTTKNCDHHLKPLVESGYVANLLHDEEVKVDLPCADGVFYCEACGITYPTQICFNHHVTSGVCKRRKSCANSECPWFTLEIYTRCGLLHNPRSKKPQTAPSMEAWREVHNCGDKVCSHCGEFLHGNAAEEHHCYMRVLQNKDVNTPTVFIYFDFESAVVSRNGRSEHVTSHAVAKTIFSGSPVDPSDTPSTDFKVFQPKACGDMTMVLTEFMEWALSPERSIECFKLDAAGDKVLKKNGDPSTTMVNPTYVAHNGKGYDFHFCFNWMMKNNVHADVIRAGSKIMYMTTEGGERFIDSYNFISTSLSAFTKIFSLNEIKKGYFPHKLNTIENQNYNSDFPPTAKFFTSSYRSEAALKTFTSWHASESERFLNEGLTYDFRREILEYCKSDVELLSQGCESFRTTYKDAAGIDPFKSVTIAGACMKAFRTTYLEEESISVLKKDMIAFIRREFSGGRTGVGRSYCNVSNLVEPIDDSSVDAVNTSFSESKNNNGGSIEYIDIVSLYPSVNYYAEYPKGKPYWSEYNDDADSQNKAVLDIKNVIGFYEVDIVPPRDLLHPVLPEKSNGKLIFPLYPMSKVVHTSHELRVALDKGYEITRVYKGLCWSHKSTTLFKEYVKSFMKLKYESKGWSKKTVNGVTVTTEADKTAWLAGCLEHEGITVDPDKVGDNPGMYAIAKLCLNSLWGKFGQNSNPTKCLYTSDPKAIIEILMRDKVSSICKLKDSEKFEVIYSCVDGEQETPNTNVALAAFTTSHARLRLYDAMSKLGPQFLYSDTDSIVFVHNKGCGPWLTADLNDTRLAEGMTSPYDEWPQSGVCRFIPTGTRLGEWEDEDCTVFKEVEGVAVKYKKTIVEHVALAPKTYAHKFNDGSHSVKSKGFGVTMCSKDQLNFDNYVRAVQSISNPAITFDGVVTEPSRINIDRKNACVTSLSNTKKKFKPTLSQKGVYNPHSFNLIPFGSSRVDGLKLRYPGEFEEDAVLEIEYEG